ncbi:hypothetical protein Sango_0093200 [Sesamum angolense]|uniref:Uncharacterized protein n=1 Tax=Sesamum angolense TaxID=2727404 RepID=A0AAE1XEY8_9LAMI|nr:hypothetical protein Sango_0093200 [Sesamum angolense]
MGKKLNYLLHRSSKTEKLKMLTSLAVSRISILKNVHSVRCSQAQSDVIQLLQLGQQERALVRVRRTYVGCLCSGGKLLPYPGERTEMIKNSRECPDELKEVISSLIFAASRCGDFPELQEIRAFFTSKFGKDFATSVVELRNNCGVSPKEESEVEQLQMHASNGSCAFSKTEVIPLHKDLHEATIGHEAWSESVKGTQAYRDVAAAAEDAFESAAYAAAAARAAVKLSKLESWNYDSDDNSGFHLQQSDCA